jgi:CRISPR-associated protein Cmr2
VSDRLLLISIGPVQDFIASARKCQDLWFGSWLLSSLARAVAVALRKQANVTLIFPGELIRDDTAVANKIMAILPDGCDIRTAAVQARKAMEDQLTDLRKKAFEDIQGDHHFHSDVADGQIKDLMEFMWVSVPVAGKNYAEVRRRSESLLAARKNTRLWGAVGWSTSKPVPKSSLDGQRESVIDESLYEKLARGGLDPERVRRKFGIRPKERLCGVGLLKRLGERLRTSEFPHKPIFHSTSHMAAAPLLTRLAREPALVSAFRQYTKKLEELGLDLKRFQIRDVVGASTSFVSPFGDGEVTAAARRFPGDLDGHLLHESRLDEAFEEASELDERGRQSAVRTAQQALRAFLGKARLHVPTYYVLLMADGDRMGACIDTLAAQGVEAHLKLSKRLDGFVKDVERLVPAHGGSLIYAGGDDVLALLPLHGALPAARDLQRAFGAIGGDLGLARESIPTLSVGLAVAHHMESFGDVRALAHRAERLAKRRRNSLAIIVQKRSGGDLEFSGAWSEQPGPDERIKRWAKLLYDEAISSKAAFDLEAAMAPLALGAKPGEANQFGQIATSLARRVLAAKHASGGGEKLNAELRGELEARFSAQRNPFEEVRRLAVEIQIAMALLDGYRGAFGRIREPRAKTEMEVQP